MKVNAGGGGRENQDSAGVRQWDPNFNLETVALEVATVEPLQRLLFAPQWKDEGWQFRGQDLPTCPVFFPSSTSRRPSGSPTPPPKNLCPFSPLLQSVFSGQPSSGDLSFEKNKVLAEHLLCL